VDLCAEVESTKGVFYKIDKTQDLDLFITGSCRGLFAKTPFFFLCTNRSGNKGPPAVLVASGAGAPAT
jgi:hypothetical protein